ncbi:MAG: rhodanese-like domain-containing protein [Phycisphaerales bacterium]|nr:rhodanese-like domain-containing protein [Phycisphaerales bacterium]
MKKRDGTVRAAGFRAVMFAGLAALGPSLGGCEISDKDIEFISVTEVRQLQQRAEKEPKEVLLIDPRGVAAYRRSHLPAAINLELRPDMEERGVDPRWKGYDNIVVYGDNPGSASARAMTKRLMLVGYDDVRLFAGGLEEWVSMQYPVEGEEAGK